MKDTNLYVEILYGLLALSVVTAMILHGLQLGGAVLSEPEDRDVYVDTRVKNEGGEGLFSVSIEQEGERVCETKTFLAAGEERSVTVACPGLKDGDYRIVAEKP